ncbi:ribosome maturation factor RimP [Granulicatella sp. zg-ZJ]|uniref:ribosome maturation factor RimP n=1 Tax=unclassified Granulicatella TaxID=2630493 RepID=UPI0013BEC18D|nr:MULTISPECIES: ribosome maturation factor RimP [unclassified Granulicatella]NEW62668.1 ribosome maturation factor RimP [Granulicatella sp. zg-ZJ]NEW65813.1 ribosome maturation factor RimP [Granulicatella sp. zg-84]QMI86318.1 ribosome maturation factor RimP [Carnobacteriaceae bacterium zg-84]
MSKVVDLVSSLVHDIFTDTDFELVDVEFVKEGKSWFLRVFADKQNGIDIDECAWISEQLSDKLDAITPDPIPQAYFLEVSSPGAERPLKTEEDIQNAIGKYIHASFYQAINGQKFIEGTLKEVSTDVLTLEVKDKTRLNTANIERKNIAKLRLAIQF